MSKIRKAALKLDKQLAEYGLAATVITDVKDIIVEVIKASQANPLVGVAVALISTNVLYRAKIIDGQVYALIVTLVTAAAGVTIAGDLLSELNPFKGGSSNADLIRPTPTTLTQAETHAGTTTGQNMQGTSTANNALTSTIVGLLRSGVVS